jgi:hypothetical protein
MIATASCFSACCLLKPQQWLDAEILVQRHQLNVLQKRTPRRRLGLCWVERAFHLALPALPAHPGCHNHRQARDRGALASQGFCRLLAVESRSPGGRPRIAQEARDLIRRMSGALKILSGE